MHAKGICIKNEVFHYNDNLNKPKILETKNIVIDEKHYFTRFDLCKTLTMLSPYCH